MSTGTLPENGATPLVPGMAWPGLEVGVGASVCALVTPAKKRNRIANGHKLMRKNERTRSAMKAHFPSDLELRRDPDLGAIILN